MKKEKENYLDRIPCHTSGYRWTRDEGGLVTIHVVHRGFFARLAQDFFNRPSVSHIDLDAFGSALWLSMDGKKERRGPCSDDGKPVWEAGLSPL